MGARARARHRSRHADSRLFSPSPRGLSGASFAALAASALACWPAAVSAAPPQLTSVAASVLAPPQAVVATDGRRHVVYEVMLQNPDPVPVDVQSLAVRVKGGRTLTRLSGARLAATMTDAARRPTTTSRRPAPGPSGSTSPCGAGRSVPRALVHRLRVVEALPGGESQTYDLRRGAHARQPAARAGDVAPPLRGGPYLNFNGCCAVGAHRTAIASVDGVAYLSERFAADFIRIDDAGPRRRRRPLPQRELLHLRRAGVRRRGRARRATRSTP